MSIGIRTKAHLVFIENKDILYPMTSIPGMFVENLRAAFSPKDSFSKMGDHGITTSKMITYIVLLGLLPGLGSAMHYGFLNMNPSQEFLREHDYYSLGEFRDYQLLELRIDLIAILIAIFTIFLQREGILLAFRREMPEVSRGQIGQVILTAITLPYVVGFSLVLGGIGFAFLFLAALYGFYVLYNGFLYFINTSNELALKATGLFFIFGSAIGIIVRAVVTLMYL